MTGNTDWIGVAAAASMIVALLVLAGCAGEPRTVVETQEVRVPVPVAREVPAALLAPIEAASPVFVAPSDPAATSALTSEGEQALRSLIVVLMGRLDAWRAWAEAE